MSPTLIGIVLIWTVIPGPITLKIVADAWERGQKAGLMTALGGSAAIILFSLISPAIGHLLPSENIWTSLLKNAGAVYLAVLGIASIWHAFREIKKENSENNLANKLGFASGLMMTALSPQTAIFYVVIVPQYGFGDMSPWMGALVLGLIHALARQIWYTLLVTLALPFGRFMQDVRLQRGTRLTFGLLLVMISGTALF